MGTITESFSNLTDRLSAERKKSKPRVTDGELLRLQWLAPLMPSGVRCGTGVIVDLKDRQAGPVDLVGTLDSFPAFGEGPASAYLADGVVFAVQVRDWSESDLSQFGELSQNIKKLEQKKRNLIPCLAVSFNALPMTELTQFLKGSTGQAVDGILCIGHHAILRNSHGWYGDSTRVPFVTARPGPEALKSFTFFLLQAAHAALRLPFGLADYQHL